MADPAQTMQEYTRNTGGNVFGGNVPGAPDPKKLQALAEARKGLEGNIQGLYERINKAQYNQQIVDPETIAELNKITETLKTKYLGKDAKEPGDVLYEEAGPLVGQRYKASSAAIASELKSVEAEIEKAISGQGQYGERKFSFLRQKAGEERRKAYFERPGFEATRQGAASLLTGAPTLLG